MAMEGFNYSSEKSNDVESSSDVEEEWHLWEVKLRQGSEFYYPWVNYVVISWHTGLTKL